MAVNEAATGITESLALFTDYGRASFDDQGATVVATVHYEQDYDNAFWDGTQLVFGDGDGKVFDRFTKPIDVLGHELSHAVTQYTANLTYQGQSGALNESMSDVFGACIKQRHLGQDAAAADWLVGEGIFLPGINGQALRSMAEPGTAYDDPLDRQGPPGRVDGGLRGHHRRQRRRAHQQRHPQPRLRARRPGDRRARPGAAPAGSGTPPSPPGSTADSDFATFAAATVAAAGEHADASRTRGRRSA